MKKKFIFSSLLFCLSLVFAQVSLNPNDNFYKDAKNWETKGLISWLPQIRPYSIETVKKILDTVIENGDDKDVAKANFYKEKYFAKSWHVGLILGNELKISSFNELKDMFYVQPEFVGDLPLLNLVGISYKISAFARSANTTETEVLPKFEYKMTDTADDSMGIWKFILNLDIGANITVGNSNIYGMAGINRLAYGPFVDDSVFLSGNQFHSGNFSFIYESEKWAYTQVLSALTRSTKNDTCGADEFVPEKFLGFHVIRYSPLKQFSISYYEASISSGRFDPCYLIPVPYIALEGMYVAFDNTLMGLTIDARPVDNLGISISGIIDDVSLTDFSQGRFDARLKMALMAGVNYTPSVSFIENLSLDYTLVTPYTYSHSSPYASMNVYKDDGHGVRKQDQALINKAKEVASSYNKENFTTRLHSLGTKLPPNSDRIQFATTITPVDRLRIDFSTSFMRHANIAESLTDEEANSFLVVNNQLASDPNLGNKSPSYYSTNGSVWTSPMGTYPGEYNFFLKQDHQMYVLQCAISAEYEMKRMKAGSLVFACGYMFEYIYNDGVDENIYVGGAGYSNAEEAKSAWINNLHNTFNNYFSISVKYYY